MDIFWGLNLLYQRLHVVSTDFSGGNYREWHAGISKEPAKEGIQKDHFVDCSTSANAAAVLKMLQDKGVRKDKDSSDQGKYIYIHRNN
jgi:hypothetical protein